MPGCRVAYNWSGEIAVGIVFAITSGTHNHRLRPTFRIQPEYPLRVRQQKESRVHDSRSILVLEEAMESGAVVSGLLESGAVVEELLTPEQ